MPRSPLSFALLFGVLAGCAASPAPSAPPLPCPVLKEVVEVSAPSIPVEHACQVIEAHQEEALGHISRGRPEAFSPHVPSHEPLLDDSLYRGCQRTKSLTVGLVPVEVETEGVVTVRALSVDRSGKPLYSGQARMAEPASWEVVEAKRETLVVVRGQDYSPCRYGHPCSTAKAYILRLSKGEAILSSLAERWLASPSAPSGSDEVAPFPLQQIVKSRGREGELATVFFQWPSLRVGDELIEGVDANVEIDEELHVKVETLQIACEEGDPVKAGRSLWTAAQCERLRGASTDAVLANLRSRCDRVLRELSKGKESDGWSEELCVAAPDRPWLALDRTQRTATTRPPVRLVAEAPSLLARIGPALVSAKKAREAGVD